MHRAATRPSLTSPSTAVSSCKQLTSSPPPALAAIPLFFGGRDLYWFWPLGSAKEGRGRTSHLKTAAAAAAAKSLQSCLDSVQPQRQQPTRLPHPWDSPGKNTGVGCHFLLQCMKVKSESEVAQSCPTPSNPMDCSPPGSSVHGIFQARVLQWGAIAFSSREDRHY